MNINTRINSFGVLLSQISHRILRDEVATRRISIRAIVLPLAEFKCDLFFVADLFLSFLSLSWHSSCFTLAFSPDLPCLFGDLSLRSIGLHSSIVLLNVFARNFPGQRSQTISTLLTNVSQKSDYLICSYWTGAYEMNRIYETRSLAGQIAKQISLRNSSY